VFGASSIKLTRRYIRATAPKHSAQYFFAVATVLSEQVVYVIAYGGLEDINLLK
jgi:hypothetical protein